jgi:hypothetical protein
MRHTEVWTPEESRFLQALKGNSPRERAIAELKARMESTLRQGLNSFIGRPDDPTNRMSIRSWSKMVVQKFQKEVDGLGYDIKIEVDVEAM